MLFDSDEQVLYQEQGVPTDSKSETGTLILTNKRVVLETMREQKMGFMKKQNVSVVVNQINLVNMVDVGVKPKLIGKSKIIWVSYVGGQIEFTVQDPSKWQSQLLQAKTGVAAVNAPRSVIYNTSGGGQQVAQQVTQTHTIERQVVKVRCRYCGTLYDEVASKCPSCGAK